MRLGSSRPPTLNRDHTELIISVSVDAPLARSVHSHSSSARCVILTQSGLAPEATVIFTQNLTSILKNRDLRRRLVKRFPLAT